jgi:hypothetical protein
LLEFLLQGKLSVRTMILKKKRVALIAISIPIAGVRQPRDNWYIYYIQGFHGQRLFRVPHAEAAAAFPEVVRTINLATSEMDAPIQLHRAAAVLERHPRAADLSPEQFLSLIRDERLDELRKSDISSYEYAVSEEQAFTERWGRVQRYWVNIVFECLFFAALVCLAPDARNVVGNLSCR